MTNNLIIHEAFRRRGFPIERAGKVRQVAFGSGATAPVEMVERERWKYRNRKETWSVLVTEDSVILQTTAYTRFEDSRNSYGWRSTRC